MALQHITNQEETPNISVLHVVPDTKGATLKNTYKLRFFGRLHNSLYSIPCSEVGYLSAEDNTTVLVTKASKKICVQDSLDGLEKSVNPKLYFRINRKILLHINSITQLTVISKSRIKVTLLDKSQHMVSRAKNGSFKAWLDL